MLFLRGFERQRKLPARERRAFKNSKGCATLMRNRSRTIETSMHSWDSNLDLTDFAEKTTECCFWEGLSASENYPRGRGGHLKIARERFELSTSRVWAVRSHQLSYLAIYLIYSIVTTGSAGEFWFKTVRWTLTGVSYLAICFFLFNWQNSFLHKIF